MPGSIGSRSCGFLASLWSALTAGYLLAISVLILSNDSFPLKLGSIHTIGRTGLWLTLLPGSLGIVALLLAFRWTRLGSWLLSIYSLFWTGLLASGLPAIWNARMSFCTRSLCITTPWIGRLLLFALITPFLMITLWKSREANISAPGKAAVLRNSL